MRPGKISRVAGPKSCKARVMRILGRIASDLEGLATGRQIPSEDEDNPAARHRRQLAEPKKLSTREERNALRAKLKLPASTRFYRVPR